MTSTVSSNACPQDLAHDNLAPLISTLGWIEAALAIKTIVARFLVQKFVVGKIEWNDWIMLFALVSANPSDSRCTDSKAASCTTQYDVHQPVALLRSGKALGMPQPGRRHHRPKVGISRSACWYHESGLRQNCLLHVYAQVYRHQQA